MLALLGFDLAWSHLCFVFLFFLFRMGMRSLLHCALEVGKLFSGFFDKGSQVNMPRVSEQALKQY